MSKSAIINIHHKVHCHQLLASYQQTHCFDDLELLHYSGAEPVCLECTSEYLALAATKSYCYTI